VDELNGSADEAKGSAFGSGELKGSSEKGMLVSLALPEELDA